MTDTIREQIIAAFTDRAAALSNLPIDRATRSVGETKDRFISVWDGDDQTVELLYGQEKMRFSIALECIWQHGTENPSIAANALIGEIVTALVGGNVDRTFGNLATNTARQSASPSYPTDGSTYTTLTVMFTINYTTVAGDPYTVPA